MAQNIYDQHRKAFPRVSAYVVMYRSNVAATIAFRYPKDGAGRLWAYVHFHGVPMVRGYAAGGGYDKHSAACASAMRHMPANGFGTTEIDPYGDFVRALEKDDGHSWDSNLRKAGFEVHQAV